MTTYTPISAELPVVAQLRQAIAELPKKLRTHWYVVGAPWGDGDWVVAGHNDPHLAERVCDCEDFDGEQPYGLDLAAYIAAASPATTLALLAQIEALRQRVAELEREAGADARNERAAIQTMAEADEQIAGLRQEVAVLRADAERYRWLRDKARECDWAEFGTMPTTNPAAIDAAIDSARSTGGSTA